MRFSYFTIYAMDKTKVPIRVYSAESDKDNFIIALWDTLKMMPKANSLGYRLASRNINAKYRQSLLGLAWAVAGVEITLIKEDHQKGMD